MLETLELRVLEAPSRTSSRISLPACGADRPASRAHHAFA